MRPSSKPVKDQSSNSLYFKVAPGVWGTRDVFVNMYIILNEAELSWVLVDTGLKSSFVRIRKMASALFGPDSKPACIVLTHGHFDHVGSVTRLADEWRVPVYAHFLELPYLTGRSSYPPPDPSVGGGLLASISWLFPKKPINIEGMISALPEDHKVPALPDWRWIHTPGHSPGHISLYREVDKVLIAGDAFVTTQQESVLSVMRQRKKLSGPPKYFTSDWGAAERSVAKLASINPEVAATGHGVPMRGEELKAALQDLAGHFKQSAVPKRGRYIDEAAVADASGVLYIPEKKAGTANHWLIIIGTALAAAALSYWVFRKKENKSPNM